MVCIVLRKTQFSHSLLLITFPSFPYFFLFTNGQDGSTQGRRTRSVLITENRKLLTSSFLEEGKKIVGWVRYCMEENFEGQHKLVGVF